MSEPRVSVVMPVHNGAPYLREAVDSVLGQTYTDFELVVVDDGSTDGSERILASYDDPRVRVERIEHGGLTAALRRGCELARGALIARMDADDIAVPDRLARQVAFLDTHAQVAVVGGATTIVDAEGRRLSRVAYPTDPAEIARRLERYNCIAHPTVTMRRDAVEAVGGYRLERAEDYDLWLRLAERHALANLPDVVLLYRQHPAQYSVEQIEAQTRGVLAARAAARARRRGSADPLSATTVVDDALLERLGVDARERDEAVAHDLLYWAASFELSGRDDAKAQLLRTASSRYGDVRGRWALAQASARRREGRRAAAAAALLRAALRDPRRTLGALRAG